MAKKFLCLAWVALVFVALGLILYTCAPKKPEPEPEKEVTEKAVIVPEERVEVIKKKVPRPEEMVLLVADFDSGKKPNNLGGDFGSWNRDPKDFTQGCMDSFVSTIKHGETGYSLQLMYDVLSDNPAYNGFWMKLQGIDISDYKKLSFWVKGDELRGFTKVFKVELKNTKGHIGKYYVTEVTSNWKEIIIPLEKFSGLDDLTSMNEFVIVFEDRIATKKEGAIYIDDITFLK